MEDSVSAKNCVALIDIFSSYNTQDNFILVLNMHFETDEFENSDDDGEEAGHVGMGEHGAAYCCPAHQSLRSHSLQGVSSMASSVVGNIRLSSPNSVPNTHPSQPLYFRRVVVTGDHNYTEENKLACKEVLACLKLRRKYTVFSGGNVCTEINWGGLNPEDYAPLAPNLPQRRLNSFRHLDYLKSKDSHRPGVRYEPFKVRNIPVDMGHALVCDEGVFYVSAKNDNSAISNGSNKTGGNEVDVKCVVPSYREFDDDMKFIFAQANSGPMKSLCHSRCDFLKAKFDTHIMLNRDRELHSQKEVPHRDFYNVRKVDTHIHHSACMNAKHLLRFIKKKLRTCSDEIVIKRDGKFLTMEDVFRSLGFTAYDLSVDTLDTHAHHETFHRFDRFNLKYNPIGESRLREIFLKNNNLIDGRYFADITREVFSDLEASKYQLMEPRISIYGRDRNEWHNLGRWICQNRLLVKEVRWMVQLPRLYSIYKKLGIIASFQDILDNFFGPLFRVSINPSTDPDLFIFLQHMTGFDCVDDESQPDGKGFVCPEPEKWDRLENPPYQYWLYYMWANIQSLNYFRKQRGFSTFSLRPHCGEAGNKTHLHAGFLLAKHINHGIRLKGTPVLRYLYYLSQIGLAMSPLSNNRLFLSYSKNPFIEFFKMGMNVSLSTDDPLQLHFTKDALLEEYSVARQVYSLSNCDVCELARNSVLQSGFEHPFKEFFLGEKYYMPSVDGNDIILTNVPDLRIAYRYETLQHELLMLKNGVCSHEQET